MWMGGKIRVLTIGHSYVVALNRAVAREVARDPDFEVTVAAPGFFHGDLRDLALETEPAGSPLRLVELDVQWSRWIHMFHYNHRQLRRLVGGGRVRRGPCLGGAVHLRRIPDCPKPGWDDYALLLSDRSK
jgi:hypothetical protein